MSLHKKIAVVVALGGAVLMGSASLTLAGPGQKGKKPAAGGASKAMVDAGKKVYTSGGCAACHKIGGKGGATGPDLTHVGKTWKQDKLATAVRTPKKLKADAKMPAYGTDRINDKDLKSLVAYLSSLK